MAQGNSFATGSFDGTAQGGARRARVSVAHYSADEVIEQFLALYHCLDFKAELSEIGIGRFQLARRKKAIREFKVLAVALWGLALQKSFPADAHDFFIEFRNKIPDIAGRGKAAERFVNRLNIYVDLLAPKKDGDFLPVAEYLSDVLALDQEDFRRLRLKLSLILRNLYVLIFDRLV